VESWQAGRTPPIISWSGGPEWSAGRQGGLHQSSPGLESLKSPLPPTFRSYPVFTPLLNAETISIVVFGSLKYGSRQETREKGEYKPHTVQYML